MPRLLHQNGQATIEMARLVLQGHNCLLREESEGLCDAHAGTCVGKHDCFVHQWHQLDELLVLRPQDPSADYLVASMQRLLGQ